MLWYEKDFIFSVDIETTREREANRQPNRERGSVLSAWGLGAGLDSQVPGLGDALVLLGVKKGFLR